MVAIQLLESCITTPQYFHEKKHPLSSYFSNVFRCRTTAQHHRKRLHYS